MCEERNFHWVECSTEAVFLLRLNNSIVEGSLGETEAICHLNRHILSESTLIGRISRGTNGGQSDQNCKGNNFQQLDYHVEAVPLFLHSNPVAKDSLSKTASE